MPSSAPVPFSSPPADFRSPEAAFLPAYLALDSQVCRELLPEICLGNLEDTLEAWARRLRPSLNALPPRDEEGRARALIAFVFDSLRFEPVLDSAPPSTYLLSGLLRGRKGSCAGLSLVFLALGETCGFPLRAVFLPGHMLVRREPHRDIETLRRGLDRGRAFYRDYFALDGRPFYDLEGEDGLKPLAALFFNAGNAFLQRGRWNRALAQFRLAEALLPGFPEALGSQGLVHRLFGARDSARFYFEAALRQDPASTLAKKHLGELRPD